MSNQCSEIGLHARGVHHRRDGKDDGRGDEALRRAGENLGDGHQPDRARRLDPVLDLAGEAELLAMASAIDWTPWNITEMPTTPGTSTVANADSSAGRALPPTAWPILGKT